MANPVLLFVKRTRTGDWFLTYTGKQFWPLDPRPEDICIEDAAHALSQVCRFGGHTLKPYYVSQHSVIVSRNCTDDLRLVGLFHDLPEAWIGDMVQPLKLHMHRFQRVEDRMWRVVCERFNLDPSLIEEIKEQDMRALVTERRDLLRNSSHRWSEYLENFQPYPETIRAWSPKVAESNFLIEFGKLRAT